MIIMINKNQKIMLNINRCLVTSILCPFNRFDDRRRQKKYFKN